MLHLRHRRHAERKVFHGARHPSGRRRQRLGHGQRGQEKTRGDERLLPTRDEDPLPQRHDPLYHRLHQRSHQNPHHRRLSGLHDHVALPGQPQSHTGSHHRRSCCSYGNLRHVELLRFLHQHADHVRHGHGHRPPGGRRHRRCRERRTDHERRGPVAQRGDGQVHGRDHQRPGRNRPRSLGGLRPHGLLPGFDRGHLQAILHHHHLLHVALRGRGPDPDAGSLRLPPQAGCRGTRTRRNRRPVPTALLPLVRPLLLPPPGRLYPAGRTDSLEEETLRGDLCLDRRAHGLSLHEDALRLSPRRGSGFPSRPILLTERVHPGADQEDLRRGSKLF